MVHRDRLQTLAALQGCDAQSAQSELQYSTGEKAVHGAEKAVKADAVIKSQQAGRLTVSEAVPSSVCQQPENSASMTSVDVTSFSLKNRFTMPCRNKLH